MVKVKICGITNLKDAKDAIAAGCDALGFVFYKKSSRYISPEEAKALIRQLPAGVIKVGVFVNAGEKAIRNISGFCRLDILQFHGDQTPKFCSRFKGYKIIKAFRVKDKIDFKRIAGYNTFAYLFDTFSKSKFGGSGKKFNWGALRILEDVKKNIFLSGGLNEKNVKEAIRLIRPDWVDVSTSVESFPGKKDYQKIKKFITAAKK